MLSSSLRITFGAAALFICGCLNWVSTAFAEDLSLEEFIEYSTRRVTGVSPEVINQFAKAVDENSDGKITEAEFSKRIDAWQAVVKAVPVKKRQLGHSLPKNWFTDFDKASAEAKKTNQPMLVMFSASWCAPCKMMIARVLPEAEVQSALKGFVPVYVDSEVEVDLASENGIRAYPTFVAMDSAGMAVTNRVGGADVQGFVELIETFKLAIEAKSISN